MKPFHPAGRPTGFPRGTRYTPVPNPVFGPLLEDIEDIAELKCTLRALWLLHQKKGYPRYLTEAELVADKVLLLGLKHLDSPPADAIRQGMKKGVERGTFLSLSVTRPANGPVTQVNKQTARRGNGSEGREELYFLNDEGGRKALKMVQQGEGNAMPAVPPQVHRGVRDGEMDEPPEPKANVFTLYEENIGLLTPLLAEEIKEAEASYPWPWIEEAFKIALSRNVRNWHYIETILRRWATEGKDDGESGRHSREVPSEEGLMEYLRKRGKLPGS